MATETKIPVEKAPSKGELIQLVKTDLYTGYTENNMENPDRVLEHNNFRVDEFLLAIYRRIARKDAHIYSCLQTRKLKILEKTFDIYPASEAKRDIEIADFMKAQIFDYLNNFHQDLMELLTAMECGFAVSEKMFAVKNNFIIIDKLKYKHQDHFSFDYDGDLRWASIDRANPKMLDQNKFLIHRFGGDDENPYGESLISERLYWLYIFKHDTWPMLMSFQERFGQPTPILSYSDEKHEAKCLEALNMFHNEFGMALPEGVMAQLLEWKTSGNKLTHEAVINIINAEISKAILGQTLTTEQTTSNGTQALGKVHDSVLDSITAFDCISLQSTINNQMVKPLIDWNFANVERYPVFQFKLEPDIDLQAQAERDKILYEIGVKFPKTYLHQTYNIPLEEEEYEDKEDQQDEGEDTGVPKKESEDGEAEKTADSEENGGNPEIEDEGEPDRDYFSDDEADPDKIITKQYKELDRQINRALENQISLQERLNKKIKKLIENEYDVNKVKSLFRKLFKKKGGEKGLERKDLEPLAENLANINFYAFYLGELHALNQIDSTQYFAEDAFEFTQAVNYFSKKLAVTPDDFKNKYDSLHDHFFTVAGVDNEKLLNGIKERIEKGIKDGTPLKEIKNNIDNFFDKEGFSRLNPYHLNTVVRTNVLSAYAEGRKAQMSTPAMRKAFPYWRYSAVMDKRTRPHHRTLHGLVLRNDDPQWANIYPPNGFNCRCTVTAVDEDYFIRKGVKPPKEDELTFVFNDRDKDLKNPIEKPLGKAEPGKNGYNALRVKKESFDFRESVDRGFDKSSPISEVLNRSSEPYPVRKLDGKNVPSIWTNEQLRRVVQYKESQADFAKEFYKGIQLDIDYGNSYGLDSIKKYIDETRKRAAKLLTGISRIVYLEGDFYYYYQGSPELLRGWYDEVSKTVYLFNPLGDDPRITFWHEVGHHSFYEFLKEKHGEVILSKLDGNERIANLFMAKLDRDLELEMDLNEKLELGQEIIDDIDPLFQ